MKPLFETFRLFACLLAFAVAPVFGATVTARLDRNSVTVGEPAVLELRFVGGAPQGIPNFPQQPNLSIAFSGQRQEYSIVNGVSSAAIAVTYSVNVSAPGTYQIPAIRVPVDGVLVESNPIQFNATKDENAINAAFVRLVASKTNVYVGETFTIEVKVYGLVIEQLQVPTLRSDGFTISAQPQGANSREQIGNAIYNVYTFPMAVAAAKAGNLTLGPAEALMVIRIPSQNRRRDIFDQFFGGAERKQVTMASDPLAIRVNPLPAQNVPPSFNGAIGNFQIDLRAVPTNVAVGDPITLDIKIRGRGSFDTLKLPDLGWKEFTVYQPNSAVTNFDNLGLQAVKSFDQVIAPQRAGITAIPPLIFSFFDPDARTYRTIQKPAIPITVRATGQGQAQPTVVADHDTPADKQPRANDIVHIKPALGSMVALTAPLPLPMRPWFALLQIIPIGAWLAAKFWRKSANDLANNPRLRRQRELARVIEQTLPQLREAAAKNESERFFAGAFRLLQEQIGERLDLPAAAITEAVVDEKLPQHGAAPELLTQLRELFQACNQARYARVTTSGMEAIIPKLESSLLEIQKLPAPKGVSK